MPNVIAKKIVPKTGMPVMIAAISAVRLITRLVPMFLRPVYGVHGGVEVVCRYKQDRRTCGCAEGTGVLVGVVRAC